MYLTGLCICVEERREESCVLGGFFSLGNAGQVLLRAFLASQMATHPSTLWAFLRAPHASPTLCSSPWAVSLVGRICFPFRDKTHLQKLVASPGVRLWTQPFLWHWLFYLRKGFTLLSSSWAALISCKLTRNHMFEWISTKEK